MAGGAPGCHHVQAVLAQGHARQVRVLLEVSGDAVVAAAAPGYKPHNCVELAPRADVGLEVIPLPLATITAAQHRCAVGALQTVMESGIAATQLLLPPALTFATVALAVHRGRVVLGGAALLRAIVTAAGGADALRSINSPAAAAAPVSGTAAEVAALLTPPTAAAVLGDDLAGAAAWRISEPSIALTLLLFVLAFMAAVWTLVLFTTIALHELVYPWLSAVRPARGGAAAGGAAGAAAGEAGAAGTGGGSGGGGGGGGGGGAGSKKRR